MTHSWSLRRKLSCYGEGHVAGNGRWSLVSEDLNSVSTKIPILPKTSEFGKGPEASVEIVAQPVFEQRTQINYA